MAKFFPLLALFVVCLVSSFEQCGGTRTISTNSNKAMAEHRQNQTENPQDDPYIRKDGWKLPDLKSRPIMRKANVDLKDSRGNAVSATVVEYGPNDLVTDEPFRDIDATFGQIKIQSVSRYSVGERVFAYWCVAHSVGVNNRRTKSAKSIGISFVFAFFDKDGDGKFETILKSPQTQLFVPSWAIDFKEAGI
ncbi:MAG: hypothetical protein IPM50_01250 [Acidobacteriota bacterium]|nr:MAG: hypothetical protein IPM50_01250 [Acidobacteriota bacterium]